MLFISLHAGVSLENQVLGKSDDALVGRVRVALPRLLPTKIARDGSVMEWVSSQHLASQKS